MEKAVITKKLNLKIVFFPASKLTLSVCNNGNIKYLYSLSYFARDVVRIILPPK